MKFQVTVDIDAQWIIAHRDDDKLPLPTLREEIENQISGVKITDVGLTALSFIVECENTSDLDNRIFEIAEKKYSDIKRENIVIGIEEYTDVATTESAATDKQHEEEKADEKTSRISLNAQIGGGTVGVSEKPEQKPEAKAPQKPGELKSLAVIDGLVGAEEFKRLAHEIATVVPEIRRNNAFDIFTYQSYLMSINDGYGLSTYLRRLAELLGETGVKSFSASSKTIEEKLPPYKDGPEPFADIIRTLRMGTSGSIRMFCIDISEWMDHTDNKYFKDFLMEVERHLTEYIFVFRIPFVDKDILEKVRYSLSDLIYVRTVSFPPFNKVELQRVAEGEIQKYGFKVSNAAWEGFHDRLIEERSDGKFYGLNTVKKVVRELLYHKQLDNAKKKKQSNTIGKPDTRALCAAAQSELTGTQMLEKLVGCTPIKEKLREILAQIELANKESAFGKPCIHMRFVGNPGTGKTTIARIVGKILKERGLLSVGNFYEISGRDLCGRYIGETAPKTAGICRDAYGSVLFIDEAYSLYRGDDNDRDFGREALDTLIAEMENHRSDFVVIMAGYPDEMEKLMKGNPGLLSRMPYTIEFPNFTRDELYEIYKSMLDGAIKHDAQTLDTARKYFDELPDDVINSKDFSNARFVRNLFERTWAKAALRCQLDGKANISLKKDDFERAVGDRDFMFSSVMSKKPRIGFKI